MANWKTIQKEITINQATLDIYGEYVDFIRLNDEQISIRLIVKKGVDLVDKNSSGLMAKSLKK